VQGNVSRLASRPPRALAIKELRISAKAQVLRRDDERGGFAPSVDANAAERSRFGGGESGPGSASSISRLALILVTDRNSDGRPNRGDSITFTIATTLPWDQVSVVCSQNGEVVLRAERTADEWTPLPLTSQTWQSGPADCRATLEQVNDTKVTTLASATFTAGA